jgi:hypothetical protein
MKHNSTHLINLAIFGHQNLCSLFVRWLDNCKLQKNFFWCVDELVEFSFNAFRDESRKP